MTTTELINVLHNMPGNIPISPETRLEIADRLGKLQRFVDDMLGDHYVDYLEFYANRCRDLEDENEDLNKRLDAIRSLIERRMSE